MESSRIREKYYVFLIFLILLDSVFGDTPVQLIYGEFNGNITLRPGVTGTIKEILWKHNADKAAEYNRPDPVQSFREFQHRIILNTTTGHLTITNLNYKDNGQYKAEIQLDEIQQLQYYVVNLNVIEPITKPTVLCEKNKTTARLLCSAEGLVLQYSWEGGSTSTLTWSPEPKELVITEEDDSKYNCVVKSKASSRRSEAYKAAKCFVGSSVSPGIIIVICISVAVVLAIVACFIYCRRKQGTNRKYQQVYQDPDIESIGNTNIQDPSSPVIYTPNTSCDIEKGTNTDTGERKALSGSKMNEMGLKDKEKQTHETERAPNQEGKGSVKYKNPCEVKDDKKPNQTDEEKEDLQQQGVTQRDVKQEEKNPLVVNKCEEEKKTDPQAEDKDQKEEENKIDPQEEDKDQKEEEKKIDSQGEDKNQKEKEKRIDPQEEDKDQKEKESKIKPQDEEKNQKEEDKKIDSQKENKDCKEEKKTDPPAEDKDQKKEEKKIDPQEEDKDQKEKEKRIDPQEEDKDQEEKEKRIDPQEEDKDQEEKEKRIDPQEEDKDQEEKEKRIDPQEEDKDQEEKEKKIEPQNEDIDQKDEEKEIDSQNEDKDQEEKKIDSQDQDKNQKEEEKGMHPQVENKDQKVEEKKVDP